MALKEQLVDGVAILALKGKLLGGSETDELHGKLRQLQQRDVNKIILDLRQVKRLNSSGLAALMVAKASLRNAGGDLKLVNVEGEVQNLFMITKLITIFETFSSVDRALKSFH
jgi:anti-sigma B factor antagonist